MPEFKGDGQDDDAVRGQVIDSGTAKHECQGNGGAGERVRFAGVNRFFVDIPFQEILSIFFFFS